LAASRVVLAIASLTTATTAVTRATTGCISIWALSARSLLTARALL
jgi:hypothetical protein